MAGRRTLDAAIKVRIFVPEQKGSTHMELTKEAIIERLGQMTVLEIIALTKHLEEKWDVKAVPPVVTQTVLPQEKETQSVAKTEFTVILEIVPSDKKMAAIKAIKDITGLGLKESKEFVEAAPKAIKESVSADEAESIKAKLAEAGLAVEIK